MNTEKTPANPSRTATARVKNPLPVPTACPHCGGAVIISNNAAIYAGQSYGDWPWIYLCNDCRSYVGMHKFTNIPLGTLATAAIRKARKESKPPFEALHKSGKLDRSAAYKLLAEKMGIEVEVCHFGWFDVEQCAAATKAIIEIQQMLKSNHDITRLKKLGMKL